MRKRFFSAPSIKILTLAALVAGGPVGARGQANTEPAQPAAASAVSDSLHDLQSQVAELKAMLVDMREEMARSRAETVELRHELEAERTLPENSSTSLPGSIQTDTASVTEPVAGRGVEQRLNTLEENQVLLGDKINDQYQTKVESGSKYRVRLSGIVLFNLFDNIGTVDNEDFPVLATAAVPPNSGNGFGGTLRQSQLGLESFGPEIAGAKTSADIQFDFAGGFPNAPNGITFGLVRLRTGTIHFDWGHTSVIAGQDSLFISPNAPTSMASLAIPALAYSGNLWGWIPQVRVEHRIDFSDSSNILFQGGVLDSLSGESPISSDQRQPQAGQTSPQPAYAARVGWTHRAFGRSFTVGSGGYYARQDWGFGRNVNAWAYTADWTFALPCRFDLSGEFYRGQALGGFGGGIGGSVYLNGPITDPATNVQGLNSSGGWAQLKFRATGKLEFNTAFGQDNPYASEVRSSEAGQQNYFNPWLARNRAAFVNFIYRPRSDVLLSVEYRHLRTFTTVADPDSANHIDMSVGVLF
jgi:hypothetical protein